MKNIIFFLDSFQSKDGKKRIVAKQGQHKARLPISVEPNHWIKSKQQLSKSHPLWFEINTKLKNFVEFTHKKQLDDFKYTFSDAVRDFFGKQFSGVDEEDFLPNALDKALEIKKNIISPGRYRIYKLMLQDLALSPLRRTSIYHLKASNINDLIDYYIEKGNTNNTIVGAIKRLKALLHTYSDNIYELDLSFFRKVNKFKEYDADLIALTEEEIYALEYLDLSGTKKNVLDAFLFACYTGARYSDIYNLDISRDIKGQIWYLRVIKTQDIIQIPLLPKALEIISEYKTTNRFPIISSQKANIILKNLAKQAGINTEIRVSRFVGTNREDVVKEKWEFVTFHCARRTFITLSLTKGIPAEIVMKISGHKQYKVFKKYIRFSDQQIAKEFLNKWGTL